MICAVLLAGGEGRRFGGDKLAARLPDGRMLAVAAAEAMVGAADRYLVVTRPGRDRLVAALREHGWQAVVTPRAELGMGASLAAAVTASADADGWLVALADMPLIRSDTVAAVADALRARATLAAPTYRGRRGHPVGFSARLRPQLLALDADVGAREILRSAGDRLITIEVDDPGILIDIDSPQDLAALSG